MDLLPWRLIGVGAVGAALAGWAAAQRFDRAKIEADPNHQALFTALDAPHREVTASDGTRLAARSFGPADAPTIVFAHGWTCSDEFWKLQVESLRRHRRIVLYDQRGHGKSGRAAGGDYSIEAFGRDLDSVLDAFVPVGEKALLVGHSLGAMTIAAWAKDNPEVGNRASGAVLCNTGVGDLISESLVVEGIPHRLDRLQRIVGEAILRARAPIPSFSAPISYRLIGYAVVGPCATPAQIAFCERLVLECPPGVRASVGGTLSKLDLCAGLAGLSVPTLLICGECDRLTPPVHAAQMAAKLPNLVELIEIERSGHMGPIEFPDRFNSLIEEMARSSSVAEVLVAA